MNGFITLFSALFLITATLTAAQGKKGCGCRDCKCTGKNHCGCKGNEGCGCGKNRSPSETQ